MEVLPLFFFANPPLPFHGTPILAPLPVVAAMLHVAHLGIAGPIGQPAPYVGGHDRTLERDI